VFVNRHKVLTQKITRVDAILVAFVTDGAQMREIHRRLQERRPRGRPSSTPEQIKELVEDGKRLLKAERSRPAPMTS